MDIAFVLPFGILVVFPLTEPRSDSPPDAPRRRRKNPLTKRQRELLRLVEEELTDEEIAARIFRSPGTVRKHLQKAYRTLGVHDRFTAADLARERGYLS